MKIKARAAGSDAWCCTAKVQREIHNMFPLHTRIQEQGRAGEFSVQPGCFWFLFLTFGFSCIFNISRGKQCTLSLGWAVPGDFTARGACLTGAGQSHSVPLPAIGRAPTEKWVRAVFSCEELLHQPVRNSKGRNFSSLRKQMSLPEKQPGSLLRRIRHPVLLGFTVQISFSSQNTARGGSEDLTYAQAYPTALRSERFLGINSYFCPKAEFLVSSKHHLESRSAQCGTMDLRPSLSDKKWSTLRRQTGKHLGKNYS